MISVLSVDTLAEIVAEGQALSRPTALTRERPPEWSVRAETERADLYLLDSIGWPGIEPGDVVAAILAAKGRPLTVHVNSPGGDVFAGLAIYNVLRAHDAPVTMRVIGLAGSIASIIAMAGTTRIMRPASLFMIHEPHAIALGTAHDMRRMAALLDKTSGMLADVYAAAGVDRERVRQWMHDESYFTAQGALDAGFIHAIADAPDDAPALAARVTPPKPRPWAVQHTKLAARAHLLAGLSPQKELFP